MELRNLLDEVTRWATECLNAVGLATAGSHTREAGPVDSDVDLGGLCANPISSPLSSDGQHAYRGEGAAIRIGTKGDRSHFRKGRCPPFSPLEDPRALLRFQEERWPGSPVTACGVI